MECDRFTAERSGFLSMIYEVDLDIQKALHLWVNLKIPILGFRGFDSWVDWPRRILTLPQRVWGDALSYSAQTKSTPPYGMRSHALKTWEFLRCTVDVSKNALIFKRNLKMLTRSTLLHEHVVRLFLPPFCLRNLEISFIFLFIHLIIENIHLDKKIK